jgi:hypothetical protein
LSEKFEQVLAAESGAGMLLRHRESGAAMNWLRREGTGHYLNDAGLSGAGALVGTADDRFLKAFLASWGGRELLLVHPHASVADHPRFSIRMIDASAIDETVSDASLDFAYLAGEGSTDSLASWSRKVKPRGLLAGSGYAGAVQQAIDAHVQAWGLAVGFTALDPDAPDWFLRVPLGPPAAPDQITVLTAYDAGFASVGDISRPNKEAYCRRHGYRFVCRTDGFDSHRPASWSKLRFVREALEHSEWVFWNDADTLVMDSAVPLSRVCWDSHDLVLSGDPYHAMNLGCWLVRRNDWTFDFFDRLEMMTECLDHVWWETGAVLARYASEPAVRSRIGLLPNKLFNAYPYPGGGFEPGDFLVHFPGIGRSRRETLMAEFAARAL